MTEIWIESTSKTSYLSRIAELWRQRELVYFLFLREFKIRYKQTAVGVLWVVLQPLLSTAILTVVLGYLGHVSTDGSSYPLFLLSGVVPWTFFSTALGAAALSLVTNVDMVAKIYFPRAAVPLSTILAGMVDLGVSLVVLIAMVLVVRHRLPLTSLALPLFVVIMFATVFGAGLLLAALNVLYRDVRYTIPFLTQLWMFATPVFYSSSVWRAPWYRIAAINPMVGVAEGFRWALLGTPMRLDLVCISAASSLAILALGCVVFFALEPDFADRI